MGARLRTAGMGLARHAFEVYLLLLAVSAGVVGLGQPDLIRSPVDALLPDWGRVVWYGGLVLGSLVCLLGLVLPLPLGPMVERAGLLILVGSGLSFTVLVTALAGPGQAVAVLGFVVVLVVRIWELARQPREVAAAIRLIRSELDGDL